MSKPIYELIINTTGHCRKELMYILAEAGYGIQMVEKQVFVNKDFAKIDYCIQIIKEPYEEEL